MGIGDRVTMYVGWAALGAESWRLGESTGGRSKGN